MFEANSCKLLPGYRHDSRAFHWRIMASGWVFTWMLIKLSMQVEIPAVVMINQIVVSEYRRRPQ